MPVYLGIEGGGTSWRVALAKDRPDNIIERDRFETGTPEETFAKVNVSVLLFI
jgi:predicted NBD/HSP70 family sugar kinase